MKDRPILDWLIPLFAIFAFVTAGVGLFNLEQPSRRFLKWVNLTQSDLRDVFSTHLKHAPIRSNLSSTHFASSIFSVSSCISSFSSRVNT